MDSVPDAFTVFSLIIFWTTPRWIYNSKSSNLCSLILICRRFLFLWYPSEIWKKNPPRLLRWNKNGYHWLYFFNTELTTKLSWELSFFFYVHLSSSKTKQKQKQNGFTKTYMTLFFLRWTSTLTLFLRDKISLIWVLIVCLKGIWYRTNHIRTV